jgi:hypothetical protein
VNAVWQCAVCETVNDGGRSCTACGAPLTRRSAAATAVRSRLAPPPARPTAAAPLPEPVQRAINREPIDESEWLDDPAVFDMLSWAPHERRSASRFGFWGPVPYYSTRTRRGSEVSVGGCCLLVPLLSLIGAGAASWALGSVRKAGSRNPI